MSGTVQFTVEAIIQASPTEVFDAWLSGPGHAAMTGAPAEASADVGGSFSAWGGYISGLNLELTRPHRIVQAWRTSDFVEAEGDSHVTIELKPHPSGTQIVISHRDLPAHGMQYERGWQEHYFTPMKAHFGG